MSRMLFALLAAVAFCGCRQQGQIVDPFWGRTTVPPPATGTVGTVGPPTVTFPSGPGTAPPLGTLQPVPQPNLLPAPTAPTTQYIPPNAASASPYVPPSTLPGGSAAPYGNTAPAVTAPPTITPSGAPPSGYSSGGALPYTPPSAGTYGAPAGGYGTPSAAPAGPSYTPPPTGSPGATMPGTVSPAPATTPAPSTAPSPAPAGSPPAPGYFPPDGTMSYPNSSSSIQRPQGNWAASGGGTANSVGFNGATVSAPPSPSVIRIPTDNSGTVAPASATAQQP